MAQIASSKPAGISRARINVILVVSILLSTLTARQLVEIQVYKRDGERDLSERARQELEMHVVLQPRRGTIYDRTGAALAINVYRDSLYVEPTRIEEPAKLALVLAPLIGQDPQDVLAILSDKQREWTRLARWVTPEATEEILKLGEDGAPPTGLHLIPEAQRRYPQGDFAGRIVGVANYEGVGISGVEGFYDNEIKGITGTLQAEQDATQRPIWIAPQRLVEPEDGASLTLTIDARVQQVVENALKEAVEQHSADSGTVIVMEPSTGEILGMASTPYFDPSRYLEFEPEAYNRNPALTDVYEPGSTFKVILTAIGLQTGAFNADSAVNDPGCLERYGFSICNWNSAGNGAATPGKMLYYSSNVAALQFAEIIGRDNFYKFVKMFGYGQPTGIDLAGEAEGIVNWPIGDNWSDLTLDTNSFGQGIAVTPVQHITAISAIANGGTLMWPHVVKQRCKGTQCEDIKPRVVRRVIDPGVTEQINNMLVENANSYAPVVWGPITGSYSPVPLVPGFRVTAKTGTSQIAVNGVYDANATIGSVTGWAPAENPRIAVLVKIDRPKDDPFGLNTAIPVYQKVVSELMPYFRMAPNPEIIDISQVDKQ
jgi:cell division protein FtsI (penicillin-binding protein 3)